MEFLYFLEGFRTPFLDYFFQFFTYFGQTVPILLLLCILFWCVDKRLGYQIGLTFFISGLLLQNLKITFRIDRPWVLDPQFHPVESAVSGATGYSFPSGHTQGAAALWGTMAIYSRKRFLKACFTAAFLLVGLSRMYLGVHTPKDVLTALVLALCTSFVVSHLMYQLENEKKQNALISILLTLCSVVTILYAMSLLNKGIIETTYAKDCLQAGGAGLGFSLGWFLERTFLNFDTRASFPVQIVKILIGILILLLLKLGMKKLLGSGIASEIIQNFVLVLWIMAVYPFLIKRFMNRS